MAVRHRGRYLRRVRSGRRRGCERTAIIAREGFRKAIDEVRGDPRGALVAANVAVNQAVHDDPTLKGAGCTAAAVHLTSSSAIIAWAGDVHRLRLREDRVTLLTREHSLMNDYVSRGQHHRAHARHARHTRRGVLDRDRRTRRRFPTRVGRRLRRTRRHSPRVDDHFAPPRRARGHAGASRQASANAPRDSLTVVMVIVGPQGPWLQHHRSVEDDLRGIRNVLAWEARRTSQSTSTRSRYASCNPHGGDLPTLRAPRLESSRGTR